MQWSLNFGQFILHSLFYTLHSTGNSKVVSRPKSGAKNSRCGTRIGYRASRRVKSETLTVVNDTLFDSYHFDNLILQENKQHSTYFDRARYIPRNYALEVVNRYDYNALTICGIFLMFLAKKETQRTFICLKISCLGPQKQYFCPKTNILKGNSVLL